MSPHLQTLPIQPLTAEGFRPFGQVIYASEDGAVFGPDDAQLVLDQGIPRFYIMRLAAKGRRFDTITRHVRCTQCLGALNGQDWFMAVAAPTRQPQPADIQAFRIPGNCFIKLDVGTWHAGPYFDEGTIDFYNLELSDTNITDHDTYNLKAAYNLMFEMH